MAGIGISRVIVDESRLIDGEIGRLVRAKIGLLADNWVARQVNAILPRVLIKVDEVRSTSGSRDEIDYHALVDQVWADHEMTSLLEIL